MGGGREERRMSESRRVVNAVERREGESWEE